MNENLICEHSSKQETLQLSGHVMLFDNKAKEGTIQTVRLTLITKEATDHKKQ